MSTVLSQITRIVSLLSMATLVACGGGGGSTSAQGIDQFIGVWSGCISYVTSSGDTYFTIETQTFSKLTESAAHLSTKTLNKYTDDTCQTVKSAYYTQFDSTIALVKPFTLNGLTGYEVMETYNNYSSTNYIAVDSDRQTLYWGAGVVSNSAPTGWSYPFYKQ